MTERSITVFFVDPNDDEAFPVYVDSLLIPRIGDEVRYWVDYPKHLEDEDQRFEEGEPLVLTGTVQNVKMEYRVMAYGRRRVVSNAIVELDHYMITSREDRINGYD